MPGGFTPDEPWPAGDPAVVARDIVVAGERVRIVESGQPGNFPVVLLHGWGASAYNFRGILGSLGRVGYHAIAPDLRGHGWSETQFPQGAWSAEAMAGWVKELLDLLGVQRCVLVGQSIGGAVALDAAAMMPSRVVAVVLFAPIGFTPVRRVVLARMFRWLHPSTTPRWVVALILRRIYGRRGRWTDRDLDEYWTPLRRGDVVKAILQSVREFDFTPRDPLQLTLGECRLFIRFGELDRLIPVRAAVTYARRFKSAEVAVLEGVGHVPAEEVPHEVDELIRRVADEARGQRPEARELPRSGL
jgi:pimeloyl-ACP methyl ester carboxylesterase